MRICTEKTVKESQALLRYNMRLGSFRVIIRSPYANTDRYIYLISRNNSYYRISIDAGEIIPLPSPLPSTGEQICFLNLLDEEVSHLSREYR